MMTGDPETLGKIVYIQNCQMCHQATLAGQPPSIPSLVDVVGRIGADRVRTTVREGSAPMPAFCRVHKTLRVTPAMEAGIAGHIWEIEELVALLPEPEAKKRGSYIKRGA